MKLNSPWIVSIKETFARIAGETHVEIPKGISWGFSANFQRQTHEKKTPKIFIEEFLQKYLKTYIKCTSTEETSEKTRGKNFKINLYEKFPEKPLKQKKILRKLQVHLQCILMFPQEFLFKLLHGLLL